MCIESMETEENRAKLRVEVRDSPILRDRRLFIAFLALQLGSQAFRASLRGQNPRTLHPRRIMAHMLPVSAGKIRHPVAFFIGMKAHNRGLHGLLHDQEDQQTDNAYQERQRSSEQDFDDDRCGPYPHVHLDHARIQDGHALAQPPDIVAHAA